MRDTCKSKQAFSITTIIATNTTAANARIESLNLGQFNFRLGVLNNLELNAVVSALDLDRNTDYTANQSRRQNGFGDTIVGGKLNLWGNDGADDTWATGLAIQPQFKIPHARGFG